MDKDIKDSQIVTLIKSRLAEHIGVDVEDIKDEDVFSDDLHMSPADFSDFLGSLEGVGINPAHLELNDGQTVGDLIETAKAQIVE